MAINGWALGALGVGSILIWSGFKGASVLGTAADVVAGKKPKDQQVYSLSDPAFALGTPGGATSLAPVGTTGGIAADGLRYLGHAYRFGGSPGTSGNSPWDCSSFVNWVVGHDERLAIPGYGPGKYNGAVHGPATLQWGVWPGLRRISRGEVQEGDIIVWTGHMGIAISNTEMVSAQDPQDGTKRGPIDGGGDGPLMKYGRL